ncbi:uncharacterized protein LOC134288923 [Aedes albopictus]|uniref:Uncharacterized protein n=1 Tax=Aedes albopictus TaxID=7160 RepID=A0ABM1XRV7_AEDAL
MAMKRLLGLEKRLSKDSELRQGVKEQINSYEQKQYISKASTGRGRQSGYSTCLVSTAGSSYQSQIAWQYSDGMGCDRKKKACFNDMLLKGPDLLVSLVDVLLRFRQGKVAVCSGIRKMFLRILIRDEDSWSLCFLWRSNPEELREVYVINVAIFGATSSPCTAHVNSMEEAVQLEQQVQDIHAAAGFQFGKILSNEKAVLDRLGETSTAISKPLPVDKDRICERVLGVIWIPSEDAFTLNQQGLEEVLGADWAAPTKRQVLRIVMKLYHPLGLIALFVVQGKILMHEIWRTDTSWDEPIADQPRELWMRWIKHYRQINEVNVPRCFFKDFCPQQVSDIQVHVFTDASVSACACVAYLRRTGNGESQCSLIAAKTKVALLRTLSIPRLELQVAMMCSRLLQNICSALIIDIHRCFLWSDSATLLAWHRSGSRRYHQFMSFRVGEILSLTSVDEWRYDPSRENVADDATKWNGGPSFDPSCRWYQGPAFLQDPESQWPTERPGDTAEADTATCDSICSPSCSSMKALNERDKIA